MSKMRDKEQREKAKEINEYPQKIVDIMVRAFLYKHQDPYTATDVCANLLEDMRTFYIDYSNFDIKTGKVCENHE